METSPEKNASGCHELAAALGLPMRPGGFSITDRAMEFCGFQPGARLADIGCGPLRTAQYLRKRYGIHVFGLDPSESLMALGLREMPGLFAVRGFAEALPFRGNSLDGLFGECVLSLVADPEMALREFSRVLRPGGLIIINDIFTKKVLRPLGQNFSLSACGTDQGGHMERALESLHFDVELFEDHTKSLKTFAAQWILSYGYLPDFWARRYLCSKDGEHLPGAPKEGYFLLIARKSA